jgi:hypothetical protein
MAEGWEDTAPISDRRSILEQACDGVHTVYDAQRSSLRKSSCGLIGYPMMLKAFKAGRKLSRHISRGHLLIFVTASEIDSMRAPETRRETENFSRSGPMLDVSMRANGTNLTPR